MSISLNPIGSSSVSAQPLAQAQNEAASAGLASMRAALQACLHSGNQQGAFPSPQFAAEPINHQPLEVDQLVLDESAARPLENQNESDNEEDFAEEVREEKTPLECKSRDSTSSPGEESIAKKTGTIRKRIGPFIIVVIQKTTSF